MTVDVEVAGRRHLVDVRRVGDRWLVTVDGREVTASVTETGGRWSLLLGPGVGVGSDPSSARSFDVAIEPRGGGELIVHVDGHAVPVTIDTRRKGRREAGAAAGAGPRIVVAPMPGRVVRVLVGPGDVVEPRQPLVVVEAMKMENELRAPRGGSVTDVRVSEGMLVEANAVLMVIA